jgi:hypothetical protein
VSIPEQGVSHSRLSRPCSGMYKSENLSYTCVLIYLNLSSLSGV